MEKGIGFAGRRATRTGRCSRMDGWVFQEVEALGCKSVSLSHHVDFFLNDPPPPPPLLSPLSFFFSPAAASRRILAGMKIQPGKSKRGSFFGLEA